MGNKEVLEVANYVWNDFPKVRLIPFWQVLGIIDRNQEKVVVIKDSSGIKGAAMFLTLTDESLTRILLKEINVFDEIDMQNLFKEDGDNIHFIFVLAENMKTVLKGLKKVIQDKNPYSVSWFNPELDFRLLKYRRNVCHQ